MTVRGKQEKKLEKKKSKYEQSFFLGGGGNKSLKDIFFKTNVKNQLLIENA